MNQDQIHGAFTGIIGRLQHDFGHWIGSAEQEVQGLRKQVTGRAERRIGDVKQLIKQADRLAQTAKGRPPGSLRPHGR